MPPRQYIRPRRPPKTPVRINDAMHLSQLHYLPLTPPFFSLLVGIFIVLLVLVQLGVLRYAYMRIGLSRGAAILLLMGSLAGSYFNIPIVELAPQRVLSGQEV